MEIQARETAYMTFPHVTSSLTRGSFTFKLYKNGQLNQSVAIEIINDGFNYTAYFVNDGEHNSIWTLIIYETSIGADLSYIETWIVRDKRIEKDVKQLRSRQFAQGGFFANREK